MHMKKFAASSLVLGLLLAGCSGSVSTDTDSMMDSSESSVDAMMDDSSSADAMEMDSSEAMDSSESSSSDAAAVEVEASAAITE
jgi:hypothetical protein